MPATSLNDRPEPFEAPADAAATANVIATSASPFAATVTDDLSKLTECGEPDGNACATLNVAGVDPLLRSLIVFVLLKSFLSSSKPKLTDTANRSAFARATTSEIVDFCGWTRPVPPILVL